MFCVTSIKKKLRNLRCLATASFPDQYECSMSAAFEENFASCFVHRQLLPFLEDRLVLLSIHGMVSLRSLFHPVTLMMFPPFFSNLRIYVAHDLKLALTVCLSACFIWFKEPRHHFFDISCQNFNLASHVPLACSHLLAHAFLTASSFHIAAIRSSRACLKICCKEEFEILPIEIMNLLVRF